MSILRQFFVSITYGSIARNISTRLLIDRLLTFNVIFYFGWVVLLAFLNLAAIFSLMTVWYYIQGDNIVDLKLCIKENIKG